MPQDELLQALEDIVRAAGALARDAFVASDRPAYTLKGRQDYLTETDGAVERYVRAELARRFPGEAVLGEEDGGDTGAERLWIVDPIDGTANFARQMPHFCISLGLLVGDVLEAGAIYAPMQDELFIARRGQGAWCNGQRMRVSPAAQLAEASVEIGWSTRQPASVFIDHVQHAMAAGCSVRRAGSGALGLAYVAAGRIEAYAEGHINAWDVAAGLLLVTEAGGRVNDFWTPQARARGNAVLAVNAALASEISGLTGIGLRA